MSKTEQKASGKAPAVEEMSFEQALDELETIVGRLEDGSVDLEQSIGLYERGTQLKAHCEAKLKTAQARIDKIVITESGEPSTEPADLS